MSDQKPMRVLKSKVAKKADVAPVCPTPAKVTEAELDEFVHGVLQDVRMNNTFIVAENMTVTPTNHIN